MGDSSAARDCDSAEYLILSPRNESVTRMKVIMSGASSSSAASSSSIMSGASFSSAASQSQRVGGVLVRLSASDHLRSSTGSIDSSAVRPGANTHTRSTLDTGRLERLLAAAPPLGESPRNPLQLPRRAMPPPPPPHPPPPPVVELGVVASQSDSLLQHRRLKNAVELGVVGVVASESGATSVHSRAFAPQLSNNSRLSGFLWQPPSPAWHAPRRGDMHEPPHEPPPPPPPLPPPPPPPPLPLPLKQTPPLALGNKQFGAMIPPPPPAAHCRLQLKANDREKETVRLRQGQAIGSENATEAARSAKQPKPTPLILSLTHAPSANDDAARCLQEHAAKCLQVCASSVRGLKLLVYEALSY
jgi:hypothetical protein